METILGDDINFRGKLQFKRNLKINGKFKGQISTDGDLIVGPSAQVEADVVAGSVVIEGELRGNVNASRKIEILGSARMDGDIKTPDLTIQSGSRFSGSCIME